MSAARYWVTLHPSPLTDEQRGVERDRQAKGRDALAVMEQHLAGHDFLAGGAYSIADISLYAYTHLAHEAGIDLEPFAAIGAWLARVRAQPKYVGIERRP